MRRIAIRITQQELSEMVGTTRSRVGVFLKSFTAQRMVSVDSAGYMVLNERMLRHYVEFGASGLLLA
jgi:CRP-like cAMP-binding protein